MIPILGIYEREKEVHVLTETCVNFHRSSVCNNQELETIRVFNSWTDEQIVVKYIQQNTIQQQKEIDFGCTQHLTNSGSLRKRFFQLETRKPKLREVKQLARGHTGDRS